MPTEQQSQVAVIRFLSMLRRYQDGERSGVAKERVIAEVEVVFGWLMELDLMSSTDIKSILSSIEAHLLARYGLERGGKHFAEFIELFDEATNPCFKDYQFFHVYFDYRIYTIAKPQRIIGTTALMNHR